ncbi:YhdP family protein [Dokdonella sp.]|uniref:YhdP family protein n=1 Tax=Dokdonella sp. TaxID=2291710 RepID=UPI0031CB809F|nr:TIGR02099 family protein [Dokdonella sp.]
MKRSGKWCLRRLRLGLLGVLTALVITLGVLAGLTQLVMPWLAGHPGHVEHWLAQRLGRPVHVERVDGAWVVGGPVLQLDGVEIGAGNGAPGLRVPQAELAFDLFGPLRRGGALVVFRMRGLDLDLVHDAGSWRLQGLELGGGSEAVSLGALDALEVRDLRLKVAIPARDVEVALTVPTLRVFQRGDTLRAAGRLYLAGADAPGLRLVADFAPATRSGVVYLGSEQLDLARLDMLPALTGVRARSGRGNVEAWLHVQAAQLVDVRTRVDLAELALQPSAAPGAAPDAGAQAQVALARLAFTARWQQADDGWNLDVARLGGEAASASGRIAIERRGGATARWRAGARDVALGPVAALAALAPPLPAGARHWLQEAAPHGTLASATFTWSGPERHALSASLRALVLAPAGAVPGVAGLDLDLAGDAQALWLHMPAQALIVNYPHVFRQPFAFTSFGGDVVTWQEGDGRHLGTDRLAFEAADYAGELRGDVLLAAGRKPFLDLQAVVTRATVTASHRFWPINVMPPSAVAWLDRGLVGGRVTGGRAALRGDLAEWPFQGRGGRMIARAEVADARLEFAADWPVATGLEAVAEFVNDGMHIQASAGETLGVGVRQAEAGIANLGDPVLELSVAGQGGGTRLIDYLRATPIGARYRDQLKDVTVDGKGEVQLALTLPIDDTAALALDGRVALQGARLAEKGWGLVFDDARGEVRFDQAGVAAKGLEVGFRKAPARLSLAIGSSAVRDPAHVLEAALDGNYTAQVALADVPALAPALADISGTAAWTAQLAIPAAAAGGSARLQVDSDLRGIAFDLPAPLAKGAWASLPFHLDLPLPPLGQTFVASLGDLATITGRVPSPSQPFAARVEFGGVAASTGLPAEGVVLGGHLGTLAGGAWLQRSRADGGTRLLRGADLRIDDLLLSGRQFAAVHLVLSEDAGATTLRFDAPALEGRIKLPDAAGASVDARFSRLHWPDLPEGVEDSAAFLGDVAPASLPPLRVAIDDFRLGEARFGSAMLQAHPVADGMRIDMLEAHSPNIDMTARGDWTGLPGSDRSKFTIVLSAGNLGAMMTALGFPGLIDGGHTRATIDAAWPGPPSGFALAKLDGTLAIDIGEGRIPNVDPGAGRILGLFSLAEIPRRLSLDFSDLFKSGFTFSSIAGAFRLADGNAYTDGLTIKGPAADIVVSGRTGLRAHDYDQYMDVTPHAGSALPVVGALAAGPVGAAAGLVAQGLLNKPLGKAVARRYHVTGDWADPQVTQVKTAPARRPPGPR